MPVNSTTVADGRQTVTTAGTRVQLSTSKARVGSVAITAETDNTGIIVVGAVTVVAAVGTRRGIPLAAGQTISLDIDQLSDIYIDATVDTEGVTFITTSGA